MSLLPQYHRHHDVDYPPEIGEDEDALYPPALAPPLPGTEGLRYEDLAARAAGGVAVDGEIVATAMQLMKCEAQDMAQDQDQDLGEAPGADAAQLMKVEGEQDPDAPGANAMGGELTPKSKKRVKKLALSPHEALTLFSHRGIYVDQETGELRTSSNHKCCDKWDMYNYTRHFTFKVYKKYEAEHLHDDAEQRRLLEAKETYFSAHPVAEEGSLFKRKRRAKEGRRVLSAEQLRVQERHWMEMWQSAKNELKELRGELRSEADEGVREEIEADIAGLKRRKGDWARLLGLHVAPEGAAVPF